MNPLLAHGLVEAFRPFCGWTFLLRCGEFLLMAAPGLVAGVLGAGLLRTRAGHNWVRACLGGERIRSMFRAALLGLIAPVGALGALPIAGELLRAGLRPGVVLCFLITAPLLMPWSFGHAADRIGVGNAALVLLSGVGLALLVGASVRGPARAADAARTGAPPPAGSEVLRALRGSAGHCVGALPVYVVIAIGSAAAYAALLPPGALERQLEHRSTAALLPVAAPLALAALDPDLAVVLAGEFWRVGSLTGGVWAAILLGAGWNLGTLAWCIHRLGRAGVTASLVWLVMASTLALGGNRLIAPPRLGEPDSHAFDLLTQAPQPAGSSPAGAVVARLRRAAAENPGAVAMLFSLAAAGLVDRQLQARRGAAPLRVAQRSGDEPQCSQSTVRWSLTGAAAVCLAASVYGFFPPPAELRDRLRVECGNLTEAAATLASPERSPTERSAAEIRALNALDRIDDILTRYPVSRAIRGGRPSDAEHDAARAHQASRHIAQLIRQEAGAPVRTAALDLARQLARLPD